MQDILENHNTNELSLILNNSYDYGGMEREKQLQRSAFNKCKHS